MGRVSVFACRTFFVLNVCISGRKYWYSVGYECGLGPMAITLSRVTIWAEWRACETFECLCKLIHECPMKTIFDIWRCKEISMNIPVTVSSTHSWQCPSITKLKYGLKTQYPHRYRPGLQLAVINDYLKPNVEIISDDETHNGIPTTNSLELNAFYRHNWNALNVFKYLHYIL